jgi:pimeloyl-ACP methyl ester carboxylesterase
VAVFSALFKVCSVVQAFATPASVWQHQFIETNQVKLHYVTQGQGELVILLHGFFEFWYSWRHQIPVLARRFKVVVPDLRGYNDSDKPLMGHDLATLTADIAGLIRGLGYDRAHIVGHGWGGTLAWSLAQTCPNLLQHLVILSGVHPQQWQRALLKNMGALRRSWPIWASQLPPLPDWLLQSTVPDMVARLLQTEAVRKTAFTPQDTQLYAAALRKPGAIAAALQQYTQVFSWQNWMSRALAPKLAIAAPTLVLWGEDDSLFSHSLNAGVEQYMTQPFQMKQIPQCGHWVQQEVPHTVNRALLDFLAEG